MYMSSYHISNAAYMYVDKKFISVNSRYVIQPVPHTKQFMNLGILTLTSAYSETCLQRPPL